MTKGIRELLKDYKIEKHNLTEESLIKFLFDIYNQKFKSGLIKIDVQHEKEYFSAMIKGQNIKYVTGLGGFLMYKDKQDWIEVTYNGTLLSKEEVNTLFKNLNLQNV